MGRAQSTGELRLVWAPAISNIAAPTVAELTAAVDLTGFLTRDGLDTPMEGETVDNGDVTSSYNKTTRGNYGGQPVTLMLYRDKVAANDLAWNTLTETTDGYLVVRRFGGPTAAWAAAQRVEVWPIQVITVNPVTIAANDNQKVSVSAAVPDAPNRRALVAA